MYMYSLVKKVLAKEAPFGTLMYGEKYLNHDALHMILSKVGGPQISSANRKSANLRT
jgi:hypothetical protein